MQEFLKEILKISVNETKFKQSKFAVQASATQHEIILSQK